MHIKFQLFSANCQSTPTCQNGGFVAHNCLCMCPADVTGSTCNQVETDSGNLNAE